VLGGAYIQCNLALTGVAGRQRGVMLLWNFNEVTAEYEGLSLASNHGQESAFVLRRQGEGAYVALLPARTADGGRRRSGWSTRLAPMAPRSGETSGSGPMARARTAG
jgi:hypothetical protein